MSHSFSIDSPPLTLFCVSDLLMSPLAESLGALLPNVNLVKLPDSGSESSLSSLSARSGLCSSLLIEFFLPVTCLSLSAVVSAKRQQRALMLYPSSCIAKHLRIAEHAGI